MIPLLLMLIGLFALVGGAEILVRGASKLATSFGMSPLIVGLTIVAFGTSAPEFAVSAAAALNGQAGITMGNVIGSNILNVLLILGLSAMIIPLAVDQKLVRLDVPLMILGSIAVWAAAYDRQISRIEGGVFFTCLLVYLGWCIVVSRKESGAVKKEYEEAIQSEFVSGDPTADQKNRFVHTLLQIGMVIVGLILLVVGAGWLVDGATDVARRFGVSELLIGLTVVAVGTSMPELATSLVAAFRGERDIAVGNVVGSNLFNTLGVLGLTAAISPTGVPVAEQAFQFDLPIMVIVAVACLPIFFTGHRIDRWEGFLFFGYYVAYTTMLILFATNSQSIGLFQILMTGFIIPISVITLVLIAVRERKRMMGKQNEA